MADFSFIFGPLTANQEAANAGAPRPDEIAAVLMEWRRDGLMVELPKQRVAEAQRRETVMSDLLREFPVFSQTRELVFRCDACKRTISLPALAERNCPQCGGPLEEVRAAEVIKIGEDLGAKFVAPGMPGFHLGIDTLIRTLDLPRWFLDLGPHMRQMRRIPVNLANLGILLGLLGMIGVAMYGLAGMLLSWAPGLWWWRLVAIGGALGTLVLLLVRPYVQTYVHVGRDKVMLMGWGGRRVLHFQNITEITDDRRLNGLGYALYLGERYGRWMQWLYTVLLQWFDPRAWFGLYPRQIIMALPAFAGDATAPYWRHRIILRGPRQVLKLPYNARLRRDLTQALAVVIFQVRSLSPHAIISLTALQSAQKGRATQEQWAAGIRG
ncbi:MAG: hypothetical protein GEEBNDBF_02294 [bacterium]|nr:hypothetical protein [bacterium]